MEVLELQLRVQARAILDQMTREQLTSNWGFPALPLNRTVQFWRSAVPIQICLSAQVQQAAIFITEEWVVSIHGRRLIECVGAMCALVSSLNEVFQSPVTIDLLTAHNPGDNNLYRQLDRERNIRRLGAAVLWTLTLLSGGLVGALIQWAMF